MSITFESGAEHIELTTFCRTLRLYADFVSKTTPDINTACPFCREPFKDIDTVQGILIEQDTKTADNGKPPDVSVLMMAAHPLCARGAAAPGVH